MSLAQRLHESAEQWDATGRLAFLNDWWVCAFGWAWSTLTVSRTGRTSLVKKVVSCVFVFRVRSLTRYAP